MSDFGNRGKLSFELGHRGGVLAIHRDVDEHLEAATDRGRVDDCSVAADRSRLLQRPEAAVTLRHAQVHVLGEGCDRQPAFGLELSEDFAVNGVDVSRLVHDPAVQRTESQRSGTTPLVSFPVVSARGTRRGMSDAFTYVPFAAAAFAIPQFLPQILKLRATNDTSGISWSWATLTSANNAAWFLYFILSGYWTALVPASSATLLAGTLSLLLARRGRASWRAGLWISAWVAVLAVTSAVTGRTGLGALLTAAFLLQVIPSLATAYRTTRPSGISAGTWLLILGELSCWAIFGLYELDPRLITLGLTGVTASTLMLARLRCASRPHAPVAVRHA